MKLKRRNIDKADSLKVGNRVRMFTKEICSTFPIFEAFCETVCFPDEMEFSIQGDYKDDLHNGVVTIISSEYPSAGLIPCLDVEDKNGRRWMIHRDFIKEVIL